MTEARSLPRTTDDDATTNAYAAGTPVPGIEACVPHALPAPRWTLSDETRAALREIDESIGTARVRLAGFLVD